MGVNSTIPLDSHSCVTEYMCVPLVTARDPESNICQEDLPAQASLTSLLQHFVCQLSVQEDRWERKGAGLNRRGKNKGSMVVCKIK